MAIHRSSGSWISCNGKASATSTAKLSSGRPRPFLCASAPPLTRVTSRFFWRAAKFGELPAQEWPPREPPHLLVVPIPASPASIATLASTAELLLRNPRTSLPLSTLARVEATGAKVPVSGDGILLYLKSATYEAGETVLAGWIPLHAEADEESAVSVLLRFVMHGPTMTELTCLTLAVDVTKCRRVCSSKSNRLASSAFSQASSSFLSICSLANLVPDI